MSGWLDDIQLSSWRFTCKRGNRKVGSDVDSDADVEEEWAGVVGGVAVSALFDL